MKRQVLLEKRQELLVFVFIFLVLMGYFRFLLGPAVGEVRSLQGKIRDKSRKIGTVRKAIPKLPQIEVEIVRLREKAEDLENRFPAKSELPLVLEHLSEVAERSDVRIVEITPPTTYQPEEAPLMLYEAFPIAITAKSGYHELGSFINQLENSQKLFLVKNILIQADPNDQKRHHVKLLVETFVRKAETP